MTFVKELHGVSFIEALEELATRGGIKFDPSWKVGKTGEDNLPGNTTQALDTALRLNRFAAAFYRAQLSKTPAARQYLTQRNVSDEIGKLFYVGYAPNTWDALSKHLTQSKAPLAIAEQLGLIRPSQKAQRAGSLEYFDLFRDRVVFPILDLRGRVIAFGGRAMATGPETQKYLNSPQSFVYQKSRVLFGAFHARKYMREKSRVILVEGYFDALALHQAGFNETVATCGTSLTTEHLDLLSRLAERVVLLYDGDPAGVAAMDRAMELGLERGEILHAVFLPKGMDPDEFLSGSASGSGGEPHQTLARELETSVPLLDHRMEQVAAQAQMGPEARAQAIKKLMSWITRLRDPVGSRVRLEWIRDRLGLSGQLLEKALSESRFQEISTNRHQAIQPVQRPLNPIPATDRVLLRGFVEWSRFSQIFQEARSKLPPTQGLWCLFESSQAQHWACQSEPEIIQGKAANIAFPSSEAHENNKQIQSAISNVSLAAEHPLEEPVLRAAIEKRLRHAWARFSQELRMALSRAEAQKDLKLQAELMKDYLDVQRKMKELP